jgi:hypothetical protein
MLQDWQVMVFPAIKGACAALKAAASPDSDCILALKPDRILSLQTGHISPQFHLIFDEMFSAANCTLLDIDSVFEPDEWNDLLHLHALERYDEVLDKDSEVRDQELQPFPCR